MAAPRLWVDRGIEDTGIRPNESLNSPRGSSTSRNQNMMYKTKAIIRTLLPSSVFNLLKQIQRRINFARAEVFSDEESLIVKYLERLPLTNRFCVDIAAQDGVAGSQTVGLFKKGWQGLAVEYDARMFAELSQIYEALPSVSLVRTKVVPENVVAILKTALCPKDFAFLSLDIDSYDYFVLEQVLSEFRPSLICVEINETIPPPLAFTVKYSQDREWEGNHFQGQSICKCHELCLIHRYDIVELHYNNLFLIPSEINTHGALLPAEAYDRGYRNKRDRKEKFPWNADMEDVLAMSKTDAIIFLNSKFARYEGNYILE